MGPDLSSDARKMLRRFADSRRDLAADRYRPLYHFVSPEGGLNDPNGLCRWRDRWHLFYQAYPPANPVPHWGHAVSDDLVHWRDLPYAIAPGPEHSCWSGSTWVEDDRVVAMYHGHELGNMVAVASDDLLLDWRKVTGTAVLPNPCPIWTTTQGGEPMPGVGGSPVPPGAINVVYDPCIWWRAGFYYSLSGGTLPHGPSGKRTRAAFLFRSRDLASWEYLHPFIEEDLFGRAGDDCGCPYFWPIGDRHILLHFSHMSGAHYLLGDYDTARDRFVVTGGGDFTFGPWYPGGVHAPTATPDGSGGLIALFNINAAKPTPGWNQIMSLPRLLTLKGRNELLIEPAGDLESLRRARRSAEPRVLPANREIVLEGLEGDAAEIVAEIDPLGAQVVELNVLRSPGKEEYTRIAFFRNGGFVDWDRSDGWARFQESRDSLVVLDASVSSELPDAECRAPEMAPFYLPPGETLKLRVFLDRSVVEVFANGRQCAAARVYPGRLDSTGVSLRAQGSDAALRSLDMWEMASIWGG
ncbi:MAG TPA: glycoside hydrolase family 32 protein [Chthonomonadales bacterium]|nr:glycoside hydrolase family 32 protein [Chthonomonadales bacterium]